ncbi:hypothetical protein M3667_09825 [Microbacterium sp. P26]|uniref:MauE/DoxX family redox-associated membrane protein n=1 Tax=Microbacterium TaxID=33882 RepID=UPI00204073DD|nr:MauE/DoxX family redox-associated membrane protein [Microbacterium sp. P26]MCM3502168.1 hypothetical protein [Microbacterium sp. P26]
MPPSTLTLAPVMLALICVAAPALVASGVAKLIALDDAPRTLAALRLPQRAARASVAAVSVVEIVLGMVLVVGDGFVRVVASSAVVALLALFTVVVTRAVARGSVEDCGCFGRWSRTPVSAALVRRNGVFTLVALVMAGAASAASAGGVPAVPTVLVTAPIASALTLGSSAALAIAGFVAARAGRRGGLPAPDIMNQRPPLLREDGLVIDVVTEAVRGRAQLLLFTQPLCGKCERAAALLDREHDALAGFVDARIVYAVGPGLDWNAPARQADGPRTGAALDLGGALAQALDVGSERPVAVLIATSGRPVLPYAVGEGEIEALVDALVGSRA